MSVPETAEQKARRQTTWASRPKCHRSIYEPWGQVLLYFDAFLMGAYASR
jgi:hypothetical protein